MSEKQTEMRASAPRTTYYQLLDCLTPDGCRFFQCNLTTPSRELIDKLRIVLESDSNCVDCSDKKIM